MKPTNILGQRFGRWLAVERSGSTTRGEAQWRCRCDCGAERLLAASLLRNGTSTSCGCYRRERGRAIGAVLTLRHGEGSNGKETPEYRAWANMLSRCSNPKHKLFKHYGARGISVCERWKAAYENFLEDMGRRPSDEHSIDRINNDGNYEPKNCRWATSVEQNNNQRPRIGRPSTKITIGEHTAHLMEWLEVAGISRRTYYRRLQDGMTPQQALTA